MYHKLFVLFISCASSYFSLHTQTKQISYSATDAYGNPIDHKLIAVLNRTKGIFIEVGALDGILFSNTKLLEDCYNWSGILIEPSPSLFDRLQANRPQSRCFQCALGSFAQDGTYAWGDFDGHPMASLVGRIDRPQSVKVLVRSLQSILDECQITHIDFFSLDTEGYELNILQGIDFSKTTFDYIMIEIYNHQYEAIIALLATHGYELVTCISNYSHVTNPTWDGTHNDYLFKRSHLAQETFQ